MTERMHHNLFWWSTQSFTTKHSTPHMRRPDSQATSVKAEPGSARGSTASASGKVISSHSHVAESIRSYVEDATILSMGCAPKVCKQFIIHVDFLKSNAKVIHLSVQQFVPYLL